MAAEQDRPVVAVIGGGLVGALQAVYLAERGYRVELCEARADIRLNPELGGRSINLALSTRGREALKAVGLEDRVMESAIPLGGRMIHTPSGGTYPMAYGKEGQCIYSINRRHLNELLLTEAEKRRDTVQLRFSHKLLRLDFNSNQLVFNGPDNKETVVKASFVFGCDGAHSAVRRQMDRHKGLTYSQLYIEHSYKELTVPALPDGRPAMELNYLHIWPRNEFMLIALPNLDNSFTLTLFMPTKIFDTIKTNDNLVQFFLTNFPDALNKIGQDNLMKDYFCNPTGSLVSLKCTPQYSDGALLLGDAAHAMVPFYGQGMNAGFEDCRLFAELLDKVHGDLRTAAQRYSDTRYDDVCAICELALYNYEEMRAHVNSRLFLMRRRLDSFLNWFFPNHFIPLYSMVTFTSIPYSHVIRRSAQQNKLVKYSLIVGSGLGAAGIGWAVFHYVAMVPLQDWLISRLWQRLLTRLWHQVTV